MMTTQPTMRRCNIPAGTLPPCDLEWGHDGEMHGNLGDGFFAREFDDEHKTRQAERQKARTHIVRRMPSEWPSREALDRAREAAILGPAPNVSWESLVVTLIDEVITRRLPTEDAKLEKHPHPAHLAEAIFKALCLVETFTQLARDRGDEHGAKAYAALVPQIEALEKAAVAARSEQDWRRLHQRANDALTELTKRGHSMSDLVTELEAKLRKEGQS
jgi:hypothetical protein